MVFTFSKNGARIGLDCLWPVKWGGTRQGINKLFKTYDLPVLWT